MTFRAANPDEAQALTQLTLAAKRSWGYTEAEMALVTQELTILPAYIEKNWMMIAEENEELAGYIAILQGINGFELDYLFVRVSHMRRGIGEKLLSIALDWCREKEIRQLNVVADPHAKGFYERMGARLVGEKPTKMPGRVAPVLVFDIESV